VELEGDTLDAQGFLLDIDDAGRHLEAVAALCQGKVLNEIPEFGGLSPSIELLARFLCSAFCGRITAPAVTAVAVTVAEDADACAMYRKELVCASD
jgi:6-pyruvoyltetrahydropterin/6-carboxytetrahydropterin synthase